MNYEELNHFIKRYVECDKTQRAIMLTAAWGTGKSHYIQNELIPFMTKNGNHQCIVVSLYGLSTLSEISKVIYLEARAKFLNKKSEANLVGKMVAKTILKGVATSFFNIDLSKDENEMIQLYESIDLTGKLIIFEDLERSKIDIFDILGFVSNLVEQDEVKILLVANEDQIVKYHLSEPDKNGKVARILDDDSVEYLEIKEKAVSDTIFFNCDFREAIRAIIDRFKNDRLNLFASQEGFADDIVSMMSSEHSYNLRSFIYACQKSVDIFEKIDNIDNIDVRFLKTILYSITAFSLRIKNGNLPEWKKHDLISFELGVRNYPLYRFCYNYIRWQEFDQSKVVLAIDAHKKFVLYDHRGARNDPDLNILFSYYIHTESEVLRALSNIENRLTDPENIPFYNYGKMVYYLISCHTILDYDYESCKKKMVCNITGKGNVVDVSYLFIPMHHFESENEEKQYAEFVSDIKEALNNVEKMTCFHTCLMNCIYCTIECVEIKPRS